MAEEKRTDAANGRSRMPLHEAELVPYDRYGQAVEGLYWRPINYDPEQGAGSFLMSIAAGAWTPRHEHLQTEEIVVLEGDFIDSDGTRFGPGDLITYQPGTRHSSTSSTGCRILVHVRAYGRPLSVSEETTL